MTEGLPVMEGLLKGFAEPSGKKRVVAKVNTVARGDLAEEHDVKRFLTFFLFEHGEEVRRHAGTLSRAELEAFAHGGETNGDL